MTGKTSRAGDTGHRGRMRQRTKSATEKRSARRFGEFARLVRRNLRRAHRILDRAEHGARLCYGKAGVAMLEAKASSGMNAEAFAAWLAPFGLTQDCLLQCLELGQVALTRRRADAAEREEYFGGIAKERRDQSSPKVIRSEEEQRARQGEVG